MFDVPLLKCLALIGAKTGQSVDDLSVCVNNVCPPKLDCRS
jgi:hypothetical protein